MSRRGALARIDAPRNARVAARADAARSGTIKPGGDSVADLGALERVVMDRLWAAAGPLTVRDLLDQVNLQRGDQPLAYTTVQTVCDRLVRKGALRRTAVGRAWRYQPTRSREEHIARLIVEALDESTDRSSVFAHFVELVDSRDASLLRAALDAVKTRRKR
jgi:predicted transcriptional regulator